MKKCPCGSGQEYAQCCEVIITGKEIPKTAEQLMRSRYSAYVVKEIAYILKTILPKKRKDIDEEGVRTWSEKTLWQRLEIRRTEKGGIQDTDGIVEFVAHYKDKTLASKHHEIAKFKRFKEQWYYVDSEFPEQRQFIRPEPKMKRNDPCFCGSGKKYKKCCGK